MVIELIRKWFSLPDCRTCEVLERELSEVKRERDKLLERILMKNEPISVAPITIEEMKPIQTTRSRFMPAAVRQQMMQENDQATLKLLIDKKKELVIKKEPEKRIEELESELGIETGGESNAGKVSEAV